MKNETKQWITYADENMLSAKILLDSHLYNPTLQNIQQAFEKYLKSVFVEFGIKLQKTHSISYLYSILQQNNIELFLDDDIIDIVDSIYIPTKYPFGSVLADFEPNQDICVKLLNSLKILSKDIKKILK